GGRIWCGGVDRADRSRVGFVTGLVGGGHGSGEAVRVAVGEIGRGDGPVPVGVDLGGGDRGSAIVVEGDSAVGLGRAGNAVSVLFGDDRRLGRDVVGGADGVGLGFIAGIVGEGDFQFFAVFLRRGKLDFEAAIVTDGAGADFIAVRVADGDGRARLAPAGDRGAVGADGQIGRHGRRFGVGVVRRLVGGASTATTPCSHAHS